VESLQRTKRRGEIQDRAAPVALSSREKNSSAPNSGPSYESLDLSAIPDGFSTKVLKSSFGRHKKSLPDVSDGEAFYL
jgi:hypothetical protein